ncbi:MAG: aminotransferase class IV [Bacteroidota bacterium]|jgi:4-amino-4-deoxychorismate lyase
MNNARKILFNKKDPINLAEILATPQIEYGMVVKINVYYSEEIEEVKYSIYEPKKIEKLKLIACDEIDYSYKYSERKIFDELKKRADCSETEDILIIKNKFITDTSYSNIAFFNGTKWITPSTPLLTGTKRAQLLKDGIISEHEIKRDDLKKYYSAKLFNAILDFNDCPTLPITSIY